MYTAMEKSVSTEIIQKRHIEPEILSVAEIKTKQKGDRVSVWHTKPSNPFIYYLIFIAYNL